MKVGLIKDPKLAEELIKLAEEKKVPETLIEQIASKEIVKPQLTKAELAFKNKQEKMVCTVGCCHRDWPTIQPVDYSVDYPVDYSLDSLPSPDHPAIRRLTAYLTLQSNSKSLHSSKSSKPSECWRRRPKRTNNEWKNSMPTSTHWASTTSVQRSVGRSRLEVRNGVRSLGALALSFVEEFTAGTHSRFVLIRSTWKIF